jgi:acyl-CoA dehydrogenase
LTFFVEWAKPVLMMSDVWKADLMSWKLWEWPFFDAHHQAFARTVSAWNVPEHQHESSDFENDCRKLARQMADAGVLAAVQPARDDAGDWKLDVRSLCIAREAVAYRSVLADTVLAMQGIGTAAFWLFGNEQQQEQFMKPALRGETIAAFALTEPGSGSDVANITTRAEKSGNDYVLNGEKTLISNAPFADFYILAARTGEAPGAKGITTFVVEASANGLIKDDPIELMAPHPLGGLRFENCRVPATNVIGNTGGGFRVAMTTFDIFRTSVGAAAIGMAGRALDETLAHIRERTLFGQQMSQLPGVQTKIADMTIDLETAALAVYRAAWEKDTTGKRCSRQASMAKYVGSEHASRVIDNAVQLFGGAGVTRGNVVEQLYREVRPTRIYEGASEVQKLVIAREILGSN